MTDIAFSEDALNHLHLMYFYLVVVAIVAGGVLAFGRWVFLGLTEWGEERDYRTEEGWEYRRVWPRKYRATNIVTVCAELALVPAVIAIGTRLHAKVEMQNEADYHMSLAIAEAFQSFEQAALTINPDDVDPEFLGRWQPFRVDYAMSQAERSTIEGYSFYGSITATISGQMQPRLLDTSSLLFLRDGGQTLRAVIMSPDATRLLLSELLGDWRKQFDEGTYCWQVIKEFEDFGSLTAKRLLPNQKSLDRLAASCDDPLERRPVVRVWGTAVVEGVVIASTLEVNGEQVAFLPSGYFRAFAAAMRPFVGETELPTSFQLQQG